MHLDAMNRLQALRPWPLSFSYGRALQASTLKRWGGRDANVLGAQLVFVARCRANGEATLGRYVAGSAAAADASQRQHQADYRY